MPSQIKIKVQYEDQHIEECLIHPNATMEWQTKPGKMTIAQRKRFDRLIEELHALMVDASVKTLELEEETI